MKTILAILLLTFTNYSFAYETVDEVNALKVNDVLFSLLYKVYPSCKFDIQKDQPPEFEYLVNVSGEEDCAATLPKLEAELAIYKTNEIDRIQYRNQLRSLKLIAVADFKLLKGKYHRAAKKAGIAHISNPTAWFRDNCKRVRTHEKVQNCIDKLSVIKAKIIEVEAENNAQVSERNNCKNHRAEMRTMTTTDVNVWTELQWRIKVFNILKCRGR